MHTHIHSPPPHTHTHRVLALASQMHTLLHSSWGTVYSSRCPNTPPSLQVHDVEVPGGIMLPIRSLSYFTLIVIFMMIVEGRYQADKTGVNALLRSLCICVYLRPEFIVGSSVELNLVSLMPIDKKNYSCFLK